MEAGVIKKQLGLELCPFPSWRRRMELVATDILKEVNEVASGVSDVSMNNLIRKRFNT